MTASEGEFSELRLRGGRYERPGYPVETLAELSRYERLVLDVAKAVWKQANPARVRLPRGFTDLLQLRLVEIRPGSVRSILQRDALISPTGVLIDEVEGIFEEARDLIEDSISALSQGIELPESMTAETLQSMIRFGSSLRDDERIEITSNRRASTVTYSQEIRRRLAARTSVERYQEAGSMIGRVTELNPEFQSFVFSALNKASVSGRYADSALTPDFISVLNSVANAPVVRIDGTLSVTTASETLAIEDVRSVELFELDSEPWATRFIELLSLRRGWLDGHQGEEVSFSALEFAREVLSRFQAAGSILPGIFPMPDGGVQLEWKSDSIVTSIEISSELNAELYRVDVESGHEEIFETPSPAEAYRFAAGSMA